MTLINVFVFFSVRRRQQLNHDTPPPIHSRCMFCVCGIASGGLRKFIERVAIRSITDGGRHERETDGRTG